MMRINKYIAKSGVASRRKADDLISESRIKVNGEILKELGYIVKEGDVISFDDKVIKPIEEKVYIMLNKPVGYVCTNEDKYADMTIFDLIDIDTKLFSIGRLDKDSSGLILITNDGELYNKIMHPSKEIFKKYHVRLDKKLHNKHINELINGVNIGGYVTAKSKLTKTNLDNEVYIEISEGKNRQIRRMFDSLGYTVVELERVSIDKINLGNLKLGKYRNLTQEEVNYLSNL